MEALYKPRHGGVLESPKRLATVCSRWSSGGVKVYAVGPVVNFSVKTRQGEAILSDSIQRSSIARLGRYSLDLGLVEVR